VKRTALVGVEHDGEMKPVACVELERKSSEGFAFDEDKSELAQIAIQLSKRAAEFEVTRGITTFLEHPGFPMDVRHNAKIFREKLAVWAQGKLS
jgi:hypothetical protein